MIIIIIIILIIIIIPINFQLQFTIKTVGSLRFFFLSYYFYSVIILFVFVAKNCFVVCLIEQKQYEIRKEQEKVRRLIDEVARDIEITCLGK